MTPSAKRLLAHVLLIAALLAGCSRHRAPTPPPSPPKPSMEAVYAPSFTHKASGLRFDAPPGWGFVRMPGYTQAECRPKQSRSDLPVLLIQASSASADLSMEAIVSGYSRQIAKGIEDPKIIVDHAVKTGFAETEAYQIAYNGRLAGSPVTGSPVLIRRGEWLLVVTLLCSQADYPALQPVFSRFVRLQETSQGR